MEKPQADEKEIYYIKKLIQMRKVASGYSKNIIIITLKLYIYIDRYCCNKVEEEEKNKKEMMECIGKLNRFSLGVSPFYRESQKIYG